MEARSTFAFIPSRPITARVYPRHYAPDTVPISLDLSFVCCSGEVYGAPDMRFVAGKRGTWIMRVQNEGMTLKQGARIVLIRFDCQFAFQFQTENPKRRDYCTLAGGGGAELSLDVGRESLHLWRVTVASGVFGPGDAFTVRLGDTQGGGLGSEIFWSTTSGQLLLAIDVEGTGEFRGTLGNSHEFHIAADERPAYVRLLGPTVAALGEPFPLHLALYDLNRNLVESFEDRVLLHAPPHVEGLPREHGFTGEMHGAAVFEKVRITKPGVYRIKVSYPDAGLEAESNPIVVRQDPELRVYWGDPHCHGWGDSTMHLMHLRSRKLDPPARHAQGRGVGRFDFGCPSPMSADPSKWDEIWSVYKAACAEGETERYVPFLAYEAHPPEGDRQIFFRSAADEPTPPPMRAAMAEVDQRYGGRGDAVLEVHIGGAPPRWDLYQPERERLLEVCSGFGPAEWLLQKALALGYRPAVCAASDIHLGLVGGPRSVEPFRGRFGQKYPMRHRDSGYGQGPVTAVFAPRLTRADLWEGFERRHTYGTSGDRIYLSVHANGAAQGAVVRLGTELALDIECFACDPIDNIDVIAGVHGLARWSPRVRDFEVSSRIDAAEVPGDWIYVRVRQTNGEYAWSTPIWLERDGSEHNTMAELHLPAWNDEPPPTQRIPPDQREALRSHLRDLQAYLALEEDASLFHDLTPVATVELSMGRCALFTCLWGEERLPMTIRWFYEFEMPRIRYDWGWQDYGVFDEMELGPRLMRRYTLPSQGV